MNNVSCRLRIPTPIIGERNGWLTLLSMNGDRGTFQCECGKTTSAQLSVVRKGGKISCGCARAASQRGKGKSLAWLLKHKDYSGDECLIWPFSKDGNGHGIIHHEGRTRRAHRMMCEMVNGPQPSPKKNQAAHECGKGHLACVNPNHLTWKTKSENEADRVRHGTDARGEKCCKAILTVEQVLESRRLANNGGNISAIARSLGVHKGTVNSAVIGKTWAWLAPETIKPTKARAAA